MLRNPRNILIVEDDRQVQILYQYILPSHYRLFLTETVSGAQQILAANPIECIILDIGLVEEDGLQLVRQLRREHKLSELPVLAVTAHAFPVDRHQALAAGCNAYLTKPFDQTHLRELIEGLLTPSPGNNSGRA